jgi:hypothetical protein
MQIEHPHERARLLALLDELDRAERHRMFAAWQEIRAERLAREERIMAAVRPTIGDDND